MKDFRKNNLETSLSVRQNIGKKYHDDKYRSSIQFTSE
jgi:hypothetical protein